MAVRAYFDDAPRSEWPAEFARYDEAFLKDDRFAAEAEAQAYLQYRFDTAWREILSYAHQHGIGVIGDIPMYVSDDSADVWCAPELFNLDRDGRPTRLPARRPMASLPRGRSGATRHTVGTACARPGTVGGSTVSPARATCTTTCASTISWGSITTTASPPACRVAPGGGWQALASTSSEPRATSWERFPSLRRTSASSRRAFARS